MDRVLEKVCTKCLMNKSMDEYYICRKGKPDEYRLNYCRSCKSKQKNEWRVSSPENYIRDNIRRTKIRSKKLGVPFDIDYEYALDRFRKQDGLCFYTDMPMTIKNGVGWKPTAISLDKIVPEKGYVRGNVVWCTSRANSIKYDCTLEEMKVWMPDWYRRIKNEF